MDDEWNAGSDEEGAEDTIKEIRRAATPTLTGHKPQYKRHGSGIWGYFSSQSTSKSPSSATTSLLASPSNEVQPIPVAPASVPANSSRQPASSQSRPLSAKSTSVHDKASTTKRLAKEDMPQCVKPDALDVLKDPSHALSRLRIGNDGAFYQDAPQSDTVDTPSSISYTTPSEASTSRLPTSPDASPAKTSANEPETAHEQSIQRDKRRKEKFLAHLSKDTVDLGELRKLSWKGIPSELRPMVWQLLLGYMPAPAMRRASTLARKRQEYADACAQAFSKDPATLNQAIWHQIHIDVPRTNPGIPLWAFPATQRSLERILYVWALRHPVSGYVQGINDLVTPLFQVFLSSYVDQDPELFDVACLPPGVLEAIEADSFWCLSKLLDGIQDNYLHGQPGIQRQVARLKFLCERIDGPLASHLANQNVEFIQFAFKWIHLLLLRVLPVDAVIRMWDTYMSEGTNAFSDYHTYVCLAFLLKHSNKLREMDFQSIMLFFQSPVEHDQWSLADTEVLLSEGFLWKSIWSAR